MLQHKKAVILRKEAMEEKLVLNGHLALQTRKSATKPFGSFLCELMS
jgi:hypothetical protein